MFCNEIIRLNWLLNDFSKCKSYGAFYFYVGSVHFCPFDCYSPKNYNSHLLALLLFKTNMVFWFLLEPKKGNFEESLCTYCIKTIAYGFDEWHESNYSFKCRL